MLTAALGRLRKESKRSRGNAVHIQPYQSNMSHSLTLGAALVDVA